MKSNFEERKAARLAAYENLAAKADQQSTEAYNRGKDIASYIEPGQPILIGHHSEKRHRRDLDKIDNAMRKSWELDKKAKYYADKVESLLSNNAISSDDPNAIDKLTEKLERLEGLQELMKDSNKLIRGKLTDAAKVAELVQMGYSEQKAVKLIDPTNFGGPGFPSFRLTNNNAVIKKTRDRIEQLKKVAAIGDSEEVINGVKLVVNQADNRVQLFFDGKPSDEIRTQLKRNGFRWAPSVGAWMRQISNSAIYSAKQILQNYAKG